uniref:Uncharacterized protein n=1 Tax=Rhizophora mucronata TaxID=61149 RepID=A0A2P2NJT4_RHIMU
MPSVALFPAIPSPLAHRRSTTHLLRRRRRPRLRPLSPLLLHLLRLWTPSLNPSPNSLKGRSLTWVSAAS